MPEITVQSLTKREHCYGISVPDTTVSYELYLFRNRKVSAARVGISADSTVAVQHCVVGARAYVSVVWSLPGAFDLGRPALGSPVLVVAGGR